MEMRKSLFGGLDATDFSVGENGVLRKALPVSSRVPDAGEAVENLQKAMSGDISKENVEAAIENVDNVVKAVCKQIGVFNERSYEGDPSMVDGWAKVRKKIARYVNDIVRSKKRKERDAVEGGIVGPRDYTDDDMVQLKKSIDEDLEKARRVWVEGTSKRKGHYRNIKGAKLRGKAGKREAGVQARRDVMPDIAKYVEQSGLDVSLKHKLKQELEGTAIRVTQVEGDAAEIRHHMKGTYSDFMAQRGPKMTEGGITAERREQLRKQQSGTPAEQAQERARIEAKKSEEDTTTDLLKSSPFLGTNVTDLVVDDEGLLQKAKVWVKPSGKKKGYYRATKGGSSGLPPEKEAAIRTKGKMMGDSEEQIRASITNAKNFAEARKER